MSRICAFSIFILCLFGCSKHCKESIYKECVRLVYIIEFEPSFKKFKDRCDYDPFYENCPCGVAMGYILKESNGQSK